MLKFTNKMRTFAQKLMSDCEKGATAIEYGLIAALISVAAIAAMTTLGKSLSTMFTAVSTELLDAVSSI